MSALEPVKRSYPTLSAAGLIELAGQVAIGDVDNVTTDFLGGRTDADNGTEILPARILQRCSPCTTTSRSWVWLLLLHETWTEVSEKEYKAESKDMYMVDTDLALLAAPEPKETAQLFASVDGVFKHVLFSA
ncbi:catalase/peroxidase HPI [Phytophthora cinnamomi]|uniref:catalase/peroxidase HPI n=1 Tax=Phytophthora cinnamomi TaxID=4785 RepID=UPI00355A5434|nr:catalase/peroxidase HPI [Phytophthora cinnamomi]